MIFHWHDRAWPLQMRPGIVAVLFWMVGAVQLSGQTLFIHLPLDGSAIDASGNGNNGVNYGARPIADRFGNARSAMLFDGVDDYLRIPDNPGNSPTGITVSMWIKECYVETGLLFVPGGAPMLIGKGSWGLDPIFLEVSLSRGVFLFAMVFYYGGQVSGNASTIRLNDGRWHHCVVHLGETSTPPGTLSGLWIDGVRRGRLTPSGVIDSIVNDYLIARNLYRNIYTRIAIDDIRIYNYGLSEAEIVALYTAGGWPGVTIPAPNLRVSIQAQGATRICPGEFVVLRAVSSGSPDLYTWQVANGMSARDTNNPTITVAPSVTTTYRVVTSFGEPCPNAWDTASITVTVLQPPWLPPPGTVYLCAGDSVTLNMTARDGAPPYRYQWVAGPGLTDLSAPVQRVSPSATTRYEMVVTDANGCRDTSAVNVSVLPRVRMNLPSSRVICRGRPDSIGAPATGGTGANYGYRWSPSAGLSSDTVARPLMLADTSRRYIVEIVNGTTCRALDTIDITVVDPPASDAGPG